MKTTLIVTIPNSVRVHSCKNRGCTNDPKKIKGSFKDIEFTLHPPFFTGDRSQSIFPKVRFGQLNMQVQQNLKKTEIPKILANLSIPNTKECNTFRFEFDSNVSQSRIDNIVNDLINSFLRKLRAKCNQYWINSTFYKSQKTFECHVLKMKSSNVFGGDLITNTERFDNPIKQPIKIYHITNGILEGIVSELEITEQNISHTKLLDGINSIFMQDYESAILNLAISVEIQKNLVLKEIWKYEFPDTPLSEYSQKDIEITDYDLTSHISKRLKKSKLSKSYKIDFPEHYKMICYLWKFRGNLAHGEKPIINHDVQNIKLETLNFEDLIKSVSHCNSYLSDCRTNVESSR